MKYHSSKAYESLRGIIKLPSSRTLRDYTHWAEAKPGIQLPIHTYIHTHKQLLHSCILTGMTSIDALIV